LQKVLYSTVYGIWVTDWATTSNSTFLDGSG